MNHADGLRAQLRARAEAWAEAPDRLSYKSLGAQPTVLFKPPSGVGGHGNFQEKSWEAIRTNFDWAFRLTKRHSQVGALPEPERASAMELDSSNSSDALLMNCFCFPGAAAVIVKGLGLDPGARPGPLVFGFSPMLKLANGTGDSTEIDLRYGTLFFEAKLTEADFTSRPKHHVSRYVSLLEVFDVDLLPGTAELFAGYQLIRNILAAYEHDAQSVVLIDARRPDLLAEWKAVSKAIKGPGLRARCQLRTWQHVAKAAPRELAEFLEAKYGV
jgi:hypothetical protein